MPVSRSPIRAARMKNYNELIQQLDYSGAHYSQDLSEVDIADPEDVKVVTADPIGRSARASWHRKLSAALQGLRNAR